MYSVAVSYYFIFIIFFINITYYYCVITGNGIVNNHKL